MVLVVVSLFEANALLSEIRSSPIPYVHLHQCEARTTEAMKSFDDLIFYYIPLPFANLASVPPLDIRCQLNMWAGQLYLENSGTYLRLCLRSGISFGGTETTVVMRVIILFPWGTEMETWKVAC